jgi:plastocyanin
MRKLFGVVFLVGAVIGIVAIGTGAAGKPSTVHQVTVPQADQFTPFALTIRAGDVVQWVNNDADGHTIVSDTAFVTTGPRALDQALPAGGSYRLRFDRPGTFVYYCRLHARLDAFNQPVAPGPEGGIQDANGNFGTPMSGVITVLPRD